MSSTPKKESMQQKLQKERHPGGFAGPRKEHVQPAACKCAKRTCAFPVTGAGAEVGREGNVRGSGRRFTCLGKQALRKQVCGAGCLFVWRGHQH